MKHFLTLASVLAFAAVNLSGAPLFIDTFSVDQTVIGFGSGIATDTGILGGSRDVFAGGGIPQISSSFVATGGLGTANYSGTLSTTVDLTYDGADADNNTNAFNLGGIDLTGGGTNDRFLLDVTGISGSMFVHFGVWESSSSARRTNSVIISSTGLVEILFSSIPVAFGAGANFTSAKAVTLQFQFVNSGSQSITMNYFAASNANHDLPSDVPEPTSMALLAVGLGGIWIGRRRLRSRRSSQRS